MSDMGHIRHHAIIFTSCIKEDVEKAHAEASAIFGSSVSGLSPEATNGYVTFLVGPDGSKEGWEESRYGDEKREKFKKWLLENDLGGRSHEIQYGDDYGVNWVKKIEDYTVDESGVEE